jgi:hypothetical protein
MTIWYHPTCIQRGVQVGTTDRQSKQGSPSVHWWYTWQKTECGTPYQQGLYFIQRFSVFLHFSNNDSAVDTKIQTMTDYGKWEMFLTSWTTSTQNITLILNIWLWMKFSTSQMKGKFQTQHKRFGIKIYKLCDKTGHTYGMEVYLGKDNTWVTADMTTHATVKRLTKKCRTWTFPIHRQLLFLSWLIWLNRKSTVVEQYKLRERECHMTWPNKPNHWNVAIIGPGQEMTRRQWSGELNVMCMYWQIRTIHQQQKVTFVTNMETFWSYKLYRTITSK